MAAAMFDLTSSQLRVLCAERVQRQVQNATLKFVGLSDRELTRRIWQIVAANLASKRAQRVIGATESTDDDPLVAYIDRVIDTFLREHQRLESLAARDAQAWQNLYQTLANRAYTILSKLHPSLASPAEAADFAQQVCEKIFLITFPCDVVFDAWATRILHNSILQRFTRSPELLDRRWDVWSLDQLDAPGVSEGLSLHEVLATSESTTFQRRDVQVWLLAAVARLSSKAQQEVIIGIYFNDQSEADLARQLGKTVQAIYNLKHRALQQLRDSLTRERFDWQAALEEETL